MNSLLIVVFWVSGNFIQHGSIENKKKALIFNCSSSSHVHDGRRNGPLHVHKNGQFILVRIWPVAIVKRKSSIFARNKLNYFSTRCRHLFLSRIPHLKHHRSCSLIMGAFPTNKNVQRNTSRDKKKRALV